MNNEKNMIGAAEWRDIKYEETFEQELRGLERRRQYDPTLTIEDLKQMLQHLYNLDGMDWIGRGELQDTIMYATIAAYEHFIAEWEAKLKKN
jgi:hypothetical protein